MLKFPAVRHDQKVETAQMSTEKSYGQTAQLHLTRHTLQCVQGATAKTTIESSGHMRHLSSSGSQRLHAEETLKGAEWKRSCLVEDKRADFKPSTHLV